MKVQSNFVLLSLKRILLLKLVTKTAVIIWFQHKMVKNDKGDNSLKFIKHLSHL